MIGTQVHGWGLPNNVKERGEWDKGSKACWMGLMQVDCGTAGTRMSSTMHKHAWASRAESQHAWVMWWGWGSWYVMVGALCRVLLARHACCKLHNGLACYVRAWHT